MIDIDICFVILQYNGYNLTQNCIKSIENKMIDCLYRIVIVDNNSIDDSYKQMLNYANKKENIVVLRNNDNLGFANGNNVGISFANNNYNFKYLITLNNDIEIVTTNLLKELETEYNESEFAVLGPLVLSADNKFSTNPMSMRIFNSEEINKEIKHTKNIILLNKLHLLVFYNFLKKLKKKNIKYIDTQKYINKHKNIKLHGCFLVFSRKYFEHKKGFNPETFLYMEEDILALELNKLKLESLYTPNIVVYHLEGATTNLINNSNREKINFIYENRLKSQLIYKRLLEDKENGE